MKKCKCAKIAKRLRGCTGIISYISAAFVFDCPKRTKLMLRQSTLPFGQIEFLSIINVRFMNTNGNVINECNITENISLCTKKLLISMLPTVLDYLTLY